LTALGLLFENSNEYSISAFYYRQVLSQIPNDPVAHYNLGAVEGKAGNLETALTELAKAVELDSNFWQAWINLGNVFFHRKDYKNAEASYLRALDIIPDSPDVFYNLANYYMVTGDTTKAVIYYQRVEELAPEYPSVAEILSRLKSGAQ
jgi:tetratricopeptide (TPR) repeat protein